MLQHLAAGRVDLMLGRGNTVPVYPWFGKDIRKGLELALENYNLLHRLWREDVVDWEARCARPCRASRRFPGRWTTCLRSSGMARFARLRSLSSPLITGTATSPTTSSLRLSLPPACEPGAAGMHSCPTSRRARCSPACARSHVSVRLHRRLGCGGTGRSNQALGDRPRRPPPGAAREPNHRSPVVRLPTSIRRQRGPRRTDHQGHRLRFAAHATGGRGPGLNGAPSGRILTRWWT